MLLNFVKLGGLQLSGKTISWVEIFLGGNFPWWKFSLVEIFLVGIILDGNFPGGNCPGGSYLSGNFPDGSYPGWEFS